MTAEWTFVHGRPAAHLAPYVRDYLGYRECAPGAVQHREMPLPQIVLIIDLGPTVRVLGPDGGWHAHDGGFVAGLDDSFAVTGMIGEQSGIQVNIALDAAHRVLGMPPSELARQVVRLDEVFGAEGRRLVDDLLETPHWPRRFTLLDRFFSARVGTDPAPDDWVGWAWRRIEASGGSISVAELARETGFSRKHLTTTFRQRLGMPPKPLARLVRFERVTRLLRSGQYRDLTDVALAGGYFDQAHFIREFRGFAGYTPSEFVAVTSVQFSVDPALYGTG